MWWENSGIFINHWWIISLKETLSSHTCALERNKGWALVLQCFLSSLCSLASLASSCVHFLRPLPSSSPTPTVFTFLFDSSYLFLISILFIAILTTSSWASLCSTPLSLHLHHLLLLSFLFLFFDTSTLILQLLVSSSSLWHCLVLLHLLLCSSFTVCPHLLFITWICLHLSLKLLDFYVIPLLFIMPLFISTSAFL